MIFLILYIFFQREGILYLIFYYFSSHHLTIENHLSNLSFINLIKFIWRGWSIFSIILSC